MAVAVWLLASGQAAFGQAGDAVPIPLAPPVVAHAPVKTKALSARCDYANKPYQYLDENGIPSGFDVELLRAAAREAGLDIAIAAGSWTEIKDDLHAGRIDILPGVGQTDAEKSRADLTAPYESVDYSLFTLAGSPELSIDNLAGRSVIVRRGDTVHEYLASRGGCNIVAVQSTKEAIELLALGRHDGALLPKQVGGYFAKQLKKSKITMGRTSIRVDSCFAVRKEAGDLQAKLAAGLYKVRAGGEYVRIRDKWLGVYQKPPAVPAADLIKYGALWGACLVLPVLIVGVGVFLRRQKRKAKFKVEEMEREIWELKKNLMQLEEQKQSLVSLLKNAPHGVAVLNGVDKDCEAAYVNEAATHITGYDMHDCENLPQLLEKAFPDCEYRERLWQRWQRLAQGGFQEGGFTVAMTDKNGVARRIDFQTGSLGSGNVILMFSDVTERYRMQEQQKLLDEQIRQSQKLEAMGQLAGGVAHDFNNLLTSIFGNAQLLQMELGTEGEQGDMVDQIIKAAKRAGELTQQLLAYARKGKYQVVQVDLHQIIGEVVKLLEHSINRLIQVKVELGAEKPMIMGSPTQIQSALLNLGVNARDAMPEGGDLTFRTRMINVDDEYRRGLSHDIPVGEYLGLEVFDTGIGMEKHVIERIFEPFFTTKAPGKGTGLGLASVYGCVKNHHGSIRVTSEVGKGSCFTILFPTVGVKAVDEDDVTQAKSDVMVHGKGHIMLVDDEEDVRRLTSRALRTLGYKVTPLVDGAEAIEFYKANHREVDIVILDMVMPKVDGRTAFREMKKINPEVKVLVVSGFAAETTARECMHEGALDFIAKPFWIGDLSQAVATYLGS